MPDDTLLQVRDLGRLPYGEALALQRELQQEVIGGRATPERQGMYLLFVEHDPPVITVSRRPGADRHLVATPERIAATGVEITETDRGGDVTYHGPGQLVVYPILDLNVFGLRLHSYMRFLEQIVIDVLDGFGIRGERDPDATGVWVAGRGVTPESRKICAMGVRVSRWVAMHGLALNVTTNLDHFDLIVPCGLIGRSVTSMERELGPSCPPMTAVKDAMTQAFRRATAERRAGCA